MGRETGKWVERRVSGSRDGEVVRETGKWVERRVSESRDG